MTAIETTNTSTCVPVRKGHSQKTTADNPAKYLIAVTTDRFIGLTEGTLASWPLDGISQAGGVSAAPQFAQKIRPAPGRAPHWRQVVSAVFWTVPSVHEHHTPSLDGGWPTFAVTILTEGCPWKLGTIGVWASDFFFPRPSRGGGGKTSRDG